MSETKHTPGPWVAREQMSKEGRSLGWIVEHDNGRIGWSSYATAEPNDGEGPPFPVSAANARMIAASPEMAEAIEQALDDMQDGHSVCEQAKQMLRDALAKATGQP